MEREKEFIKIKILSDLHLEVYRYKLEYNGEDILILAGDISPNYVQAQSMIKKYILENKSVIVIFVLGNHDYYGRKIEETYEIWNKFKTDRFYYLQNKSVVIHGIRFFGSTMWTDLNNLNSALANMCDYVISDFTKIIDFDPIDFTEIHAISKKRLEQEIEKSEEKMIVITHHLPSVRSISKGKWGNPLNFAFTATDMDSILDSEKIIMYCHGHSHCSAFWKSGNTFVVSNPRGYSRYNEEKKLVENENSNFDSNFSVKINI